MESIPCDLLSWDSELFGVRIARARERRLDGKRMSQMLEWCARHAVDCLYLLADPADDLTAALAEAHGFHLVDVRVTLGRSLGGEAAQAQPDPEVRPFRNSDLEALRKLARSCYRESRFFHDPHFTRERCEALYETWIERSTRGYADAVLVLESGGRPGGYISCHLSAEGTGRIGLLALQPEQRGCGLGRQLVNAALGYFERHHMQRAAVVTQGRNVGAQRLYQRCGFLTESVQLWYHRWFEKLAAARDSGDSGACTLTASLLTSRD